jgi:hypothetical protein
MWTSRKTVFYQAHPLQAAVEPLVSRGMECTMIPNTSPGLNLGLANKIEMLRNTVRGFSQATCRRDRSHHSLPRCGHNSASFGSSALVMADRPAPAAASDVAASFLRMTRGDDPQRVTTVWLYVWLCA